MKKYLLLITGAVLGFAVAYYWVSWKKEAELKRRLADAEANFQAERTSLDAALTATKARAGQARAGMSAASLHTTDGNKLTPQDVLDALIALDPRQTETGRNQTMRQIIYELQRLADFGPAALPAIKKFIAQNKDVEYDADEARASGSRGDRKPPAEYASARMDFLVPPSLRLGLMEVLRQIGGPDSEKILAEILATSGRGIEIAYLSRILEELAPGKYRDAALTAAKELLATPPTIENPSRLDMNARSYLYEVFKIQGDTNFAQMAQARLLTPEGKIDRSTAGYLALLLKDQAMPLLYATYNDPQIASNHLERSVLLNQVFNFVGANDVANTMFAEMVVSEGVPANLRSFTILSLYGAHRADTPRDPEVIKGRLALVENLRRDVKDERLVRALDEAQAGLGKLFEAAVAPKPPPPPPPPAAAPPPGE